MLASLKHDNIVEFIHFNLEATDGEKNGENKKIAYMVMELAEGGSLVEKILIDGAFSEQICRHYFKQMLAAVHYCHT